MGLFFLPPFNVLVVSSILARRGAEPLYIPTNDTHHTRTNNISNYKPTTFSSAILAMQAAHRTGAVSPIDDEAGAPESENREHVASSPRGILVLLVVSYHHTWYYSNTRYRSDQKRSPWRQKANTRPGTWYLVSFFNMFSCVSYLSSPSSSLSLYSSMSSSS